jgi:hypothetical protein
MRRWLVVMVVTVVLTSVHAAPSETDATTAAANSTASTTTIPTETTGTTAPTPESEVTPKKKKRKRIGRKPTRSSLRNHRNMPHGFRWPPSKLMKAAGQACIARLDELAVPYKPAKREGRIVRAVTIGDDGGALMLGGIEYVSRYKKPPHKLDCQLALALETFGKDLYAIGVRQVKFGSIYRWTNVRVRGKTKNMLSRHGLGIAMDIYSVFDDVGRELVVSKDYNRGEPLLLSIEQVVNASGRFRILLTPKNDPVSHDDHFHLEVDLDYNDRP